MKRIFCFAIAGLCLLMNATAQDKKQEYRTRVKELQQSITTYYLDANTGYYREFDRPDTSHKKEYSYLWPLCGLVQASNETESIDLSTIPMKSVMKTIHDYNDNRQPAPAYAAYIPKLEKDDRFYDDNQWIGIACLDAYERTGDKAYLAEGIKVYRFMMTGFDTIGGGGLYWKEHDLSTKNTCSNGPGVIVALQLYKATKEKAYLDTALLLYTWTRKFLLSPDGVYYDHVRLPSGGIDKRTYTYNSGTMLQSAVLLYEITGDADYLSHAKLLAASAHKWFYKKDRLPGNSWFNVVLLRGYLALDKHDRQQKYIDAFMTDADTRWKKERDDRGLLGKGKRKELIEQAASLEIYARLARYLSN